MTSGPSGSGFGSGSGVGGIGSTSSPSSPFVFPKFSELPELLFVELSSLFSSSLLSSSVFPCPGQVSFVKVSLSKYSVMEGHPFNKRTKSFLSEALHHFVNIYFRENSV